MRRVNILIAFLFIFFVPATVQATTEDKLSYFEQAMELYKEGPSRAPEIIDLLKRELKEHPENNKAVKLLGITYFGIERFEEAIEQFDRAIDLASKDGSIIPQILFMKAEALHELKRDAEAKKILDDYWAFWQDGGKLQQRYKVLYPQVIEGLKKQGAPSNQTP